MEKNLQALTREDLAAASEAFRAERANLVAKNAVSSRGIRAAARVPEAVAASALGFDVEVPRETAATRSAPAAAGCSPA